MRINSPSWGTTDDDVERSLEAILRIAASHKLVLQSKTGFVGRRLGLRRKSHLPSERKRYRSFKAPSEAQEPGRLALSGW